MSGSVFDEEGDSSLYFMFISSLVCLIPASYFKISGSSYTYTEPKNGNKTFLKLSKNKKTTKVKKSFDLGIGDIFYYALVVVTLGLFFQILRLEGDGLQVFNPYQILEVEIGTSEKEIKKVYRALSKKYHPDRNPGDEEANKKFIELTKAYQTLTDVAARENWEKYGNPDGPQATESNFAIPKWIVDENNRFVILACYCLGFMVALPYFVATKWHSAGKYSSSQKVLKKTVEAYYHYTKDNMSTMCLLEVLSASVEFMEVGLNRSRDIIKKLDEKMIGFVTKTNINADYCINARTVLYAHLNRENITDEVLKETQKRIVSAVPDLIQGGLLATLAQGKCIKDSTLALMELHQMIVQGMSESMSPLMMLPYISQEMVEDENSPLPPTIKNFISMDEKAKKNWLNKYMDSQQYSEVICVAENMPALFIDIKIGEAITAKTLVPITIELERTTAKGEYERIEKIKKLKNSGKDVDQLYSPGNMAKKVASVIKKKAHTDEGDFDDDEWEEINRKRKQTHTHEKSPLVHCPYFPEFKNEGWWLMLSYPVGNQIPAQLKKVENLVDTIEVDMIIPGYQKPGTYELVLDIVSDSYYGLRYQQNIVFQVGKYQEPQKIETIFSEDEEEEVEESSEEDSDLQSDSDSE